MGEEVRSVTLGSPGASSACQVAYQVGADEAWRLSRGGTKKKGRRWEEKWNHLEETNLLVDTESPMCSGAWKWILGAQDLDINDRWTMIRRLSCKHLHHSTDEEKRKWQEVSPPSEQADYYCFCKGITMRVLLITLVVILPWWKWKLYLKRRD